MVYIPREDTITLCDTCMGPCKTPTEERQGRCMECYWDLRYVDCEYCCSLTTNSTGVCTRCTTTPEWYR